MIKEDYVSFKVAKLLKDKGFNGKCIYYYIQTKEMFKIDTRYHTALTTQELLDLQIIGEKEDRYAAPTQAMAMKWLREVHKLYIEITPSSKTNEFIVDSYRIDIVTKTFDTIYVSSGYDTYEQACEAAIKYCLENLI